MSILDSLKAKAKADKKTIVLPESMDKRTSFLPVRYNYFSGYHR